MTRIRKLWSNLFVSNEINDANSYQKLVNIFIEAWNEIDVDLIRRSFSMTGIVPVPRWPYNLPSPPIIAPDNIPQAVIEPVRAIVPPELEVEVESNKPDANQPTNILLRLMKAGQRIYK